MPFLLAHKNVNLVNYTILLNIMHLFPWRHKVKSHASVVTELLQINPSNNIAQPGPKYLIAAMTRASR